MGLKQKVVSTVVDITTSVQNARFTDYITRLGGLLGKSHEGKRDLYSVYGYPEQGDLAGDAGFETMYRYSRRQGIANRITFGVARTCWRDGFNVLRDPEDEESVELVEELVELNKRGFIKKLEQADTLNRIGRFSILLIGVPDGLDLDQPIGAALSGDAIKAVYFKPFAYDSITITKWESDVQNPRYGLPVLYQVSQNLRRSESQKDTKSLSTLLIHYSRVVHMNENALDSDVEGMGALEPIFNRILDLEKATGGASEAYFRNARGKIAFDVDPSFSAELLRDEELKESFNEGVEKFTNEWQDHIISAGAKARAITTPQQSPLDTVKVSLWEVSGYTGAPLRILTGEGAGQLAGSEDQLAMNQIIADRQRVVCSQWAFEALEILVAAKVIKNAIPADWTIVFPQQRAATEKEQADIDNKKADTLSKVASAASSMGGDSIDLESALDELNLGGITVEELGDDDLTNPDDIIPEPEPEEGDE